MTEENIYNLLNPLQKLYIISPYAYAMIVYIIFMISVALFVYSRIERNLHKKRAKIELIISIPFIILSMVSAIYCHLSDSQTTLIQSYLNSNAFKNDYTPNGDSLNISSDFGVVPIYSLNKGKSSDIYLKGMSLNSTGDSGIHFTNDVSDKSKTIRGSVKSEFKLNSDRVSVNPKSETSYNSAYIVVRTINKKEHKHIIMIVNALLKRDVSKDAYVDIYIPNHSWEPVYYRHDFSLNTDERY